MLNEAELALADGIVDIGRRMYERGFVAANDGNISCRAPDGNILITPTLCSKGSLTREMIIKVDPSDGHVIDGSRGASSETKMHLRVYKENPSVGAVCHAHPVAATSFAIAGIPLDAPIYPEAIVTLGKVPVAPYAQPGTQAVPDSVAPYCQGKAVLLANHGALTWGRDLIEAWYRMESLENYAKITLNVYYILKQVKPLTEAQVKSYLDAMAGIKGPSENNK